MAVHIEMNSFVLLASHFERSLVHVSENSFMYTSASLSSIEYHPGKDALDTDKDIPEIRWDGTSKKSIVREGLPTIQEFALKAGLPGEEKHTPGKGRVAGNSLALSGAISNLMTGFEVFPKGDSATAESWDKLASSRHRWIFTSVVIVILIVQLFIATVYFGSSASKTPGGDDPNDDEEEKQEGETRRLRSGCC